MACVSRAFDYERRVSTLCCGLIEFSHDTTGDYQGEWIGKLDHGARLDETFEDIGFEGPFTRIRRKPTDTKMTRLYEMLESPMRAELATRVDGQAKKEWPRDSVDDVADFTVRTSPEQVDV